MGGVRTQKGLEKILKGKAKIKSKSKKKDNLWKKKELKLVKEASRNVSENVIGKKRHNILKKKLKRELGKGKD